VRLKPIYTSCISRFFIFLKLWKGWIPIFFVFPLSRLTVVLRFKHYQTTTRLTTLIMYNSRMQFRRIIWPLKYSSMHVKYLLSMNSYSLSITRLLNRVECKIKEPADNLFFVQIQERFITGFTMVNKCQNNKISRILV